MSSTNSSISAPRKTTPVYTEYQFTQMRDVLVPLMLACPARLIPSINHDMRQLFCDAGERLFGDKRLGWRLEDYAEFIFCVKTGRYEPEHPLFADMPRMALMWRGREKKTEGQSYSASELAEIALTYPGPMQIVRKAFEDEFMRWLATTSKASDYGMERDE